MACFALQEFKGRQWLRSLTLEVLKDYQEKIGNQRNFDRQITTTMEYITEYKNVKDFNSQGVGS